jgi:hypothetical protein
VVQLRDFNAQIDNDCRPFFASLPSLVIDKAPEIAQGVQGALKSLLNQGASPVRQVHVSVPPLPNLWQQATIAIESGTLPPGRAGMSVAVGSAPLHPDRRSIIALRFSRRGQRLLTQYRSLARSRHRDHRPTAPLSLTLRITLRPAYGRSTQAVQSIHVHA